MNRHKNAKTNPYSRALIVERSRQGWTQEKIADSLGISRRTVCKWIKRWSESGNAGLEDRPSKPRRSPNKLAQVCEQAILQLRRTFLMPAFGIAAHLKLAYSTVCRYLRKHGLSRKRDIFPPQKPRL